MDKYKQLINSNIFILVYIFKIMTLDKLLETLSEFSNIGSVVGFENNFRENLENEFREAGYETEITQEGLLIVKSLEEEYTNHYTCSHIDRSGLVIDDGKLTYAGHNLKDKLGLKAKPTEKACKKIGDRFMGKQVKINEENYSVSDYQISRNEKDESNRLEFFLEEDIDLSSFDQQSVPYIDSIFYDNKEITGQLDNVINVALLYTMMVEGEVKGNVIFSTREEIGLSGTLIANYLAKEGIYSTEDLLILDTTPFSEADYVTDEISLRKRDSRDFYSQNKVEMLESICKELKIPYRFKDKILEEKGDIKIKDDGSVIGYGLTELGKIVQDSNGKYNGATLQLPNLGDGVEEKISFESLNNYITLLKEYYNRI